MIATLTYLHSTISTKRHRVRSKPAIDALLADQPLTGGLSRCWGSERGFDCRLSGRDDPGVRTT
jgi:hypothetical protein